MSKTQEALEQRKQLLAQFSKLIAELVSKVNASEQELKLAKEQIAQLLAEDASNAEEVLQDNPEIQSLIDIASSATPAPDQVATTTPAQIDPPHLTEAAPVKGGVGASELTPDLTSESPIE